MRILAVDPGEKRIGLAVSDETGMIANPLRVILHTNRKNDAEAILNIYREQNAALVVIGQALDDEGGVTSSGRHAQRLAEEISSQQPVPIVFWDESFSTNQAVEARRSMNVRRSKRKGHIDDLAAAIILQSYLDSLTTTLGVAEAD
jgi:putative holliday junction resolvase